MDPKVRALLDLIEAQLKELLEHPGVYELENGGTLYVGLESLE